MNNELGPPIETEDQAKNWILELVEETEALRKQCDLVVMVKDQRTWFLKWMITRGKSLGVLHALKRADLLSDVMYEDMRQRILNTAVPTVQQGVLPFE